MAPRIAPLADDERDAAVALWHAVGLTRPWNDPHTDLERALAGPSSDVLAATDCGRLLGTAMVGHDGHRGWVYYVAVAPTARRRGIGRALMAAAEAWVAERGIAKLELMIRADNAPAREFYAALGYGREDVTVMSRRLG